MGANLIGAILSQANLIEANCTGAIFSEAVLIEADLRETRLSEANLSGAVLIGAFLGRARLNSVNFSETIVEQARFSNNAGLMENEKAALEERGAIFEEPPPSISDIPDFVKRQ